MAEQRDNSGTLSRNDKATTEKHPSHKGQCIIDGTAYWISAWTRTSSKDGSRFFSLSFEPKDKGGTYQVKKPENKQDDFLDDVPF